MLKVLPTVEFILVKLILQVLSMKNLQYGYLLNMGVHLKGQKYIIQRWR